MDVLDALQQAVVAAAERVGPAVVGLGRGWGRGTGVVFEPGLVLTCAHVLRGDEVAVTFSDGRTEQGRVTGADADLDVAVVAVETGGVTPVAWDPSVTTSLGAPVLALADPSGRGLRTTFGLVSATGRSFRGPGGRRIAGSIEHSAPLPRGSSGGPLVDTDSRLLGLNAVRREGGLILALPADELLRTRAAALARGESAGRPRLGVALAPARHARRMRSAVGLPERDGLLVRGVVDDTPAARAGLQRGDLLVRAGDRELRALDDLFDALEGAGDSLTLGVVRGEEERDVAVEWGYSLQFVKHCSRITDVPNSDCPVCRTAEIVCGKWTLLVIRDLADGRLRFGELERSLEGISPRTLSLRLRSLEEEGIVQRKTFPEVPPRVEYALTAKGRALVPIIESMREYGTEWLGAVGSCSEPSEVPLAVA